MDESVRKAMARWPDVPALYGWLRLDATGRWYVQGELITHRGLIEYIGRNYACDQAGRWFFQNGPQRGYVHLDYTPWILHVDSSGTLRNHVGTAITPGSCAAIDDQGNLLVDSERGVGLIDPDSLPTVIEGLVDSAGNPASEDALTAIMAGDASGDIRLDIAGQQLALERVPRAEVPVRFGYVSNPHPDDSPDPDPSPGRTTP